MVRRFHRRSPSGRVGRLRRQPRRAPFRIGGRASHLGRHDGGARARAARARQARTHRAGRDRPAVRPARRRELPGLDRDSLRAGLGAARSRALLWRDGRRGGGGGTNRRAREKLARSPAAPLALFCSIRGLMRRSIALALLLSGCAVPPGQPGPESKPEAPPAVPAPPAPAQRETVAVAGLLETARSEQAAGNMVAAAASLERALRIEPRNPRLWQELARVRLRQGQHVQAENMAARSNSWAGDDRSLRAENWRLIAEARRARGDADGAKAALDQASR